MAKYKFLTDDTRSTPKNYYKGEIGEGTEVPIGTKARMGKLTTERTVHFVRNKYHSWVPISELEIVSDSAAVSGATPTSSNAAQQKADEASFKQGSAMLGGVSNSLDGLEGKLKRIQRLSTIGFVGGLGFAYYKKSGVGGWIGYGILGSLAGWAIAFASFKLMSPSTPDKAPAKPENTGGVKPLLGGLPPKKDNKSRASKLQEILAVSKKMGAGTADLEFIKFSAEKMPEAEFNAKYEAFKKDTGASADGGLPTDKTINASGNDNWGA